MDASRSSGRRAGTGPTVDGGPVPAPRPRVGARRRVRRAEGVAPWLRPVHDRPAQPLRRSAARRRHPPDRAARRRRQRTFVLDTSRAALRPAGDAALRRARGRAPGRRGHRARGQAPPPRARATSPGRRCGCSTTCGSARPARRAGAGRRGRRHAAGRAQPHRPAVAAGRLPPGRQRHAGSSRSPGTSPPRAATSPWSARTCRCGSRRRRSASTPRSTAPSSPSTPAGPAWPSSTSPARRWTPLYDAGPGRARGGRRAALPHRAGAARPRAAAASGRVGADKQIRLVRGDRDAFGLHGRSAEQRIALDLLLDPDVGIVSLGGRAGTGKSRAGPVRRPRGGDGAAPAPQGRRLPAAVRRRRPGARLPARHRGREDEPLGAGGLRHPRRAGLHARSSRRSSTAGCSRCCR